MPVHGSWRAGVRPAHVVEREFSAMVRQCIAQRRFGSIDVLRREIEAWVEARNAEGATVE